MDWAHVLVVVKCQNDGCSLSSKDGAVAWHSFGQLAAGFLAILEMAVDDCCCPHSLTHFGTVSVNFIVRSLCFTILIEHSSLYGDHTFVHRFNEVVYFEIVMTNSVLLSAGVMASSTLRPMGGTGGRVRSPLPFGLGAYKSPVVRSYSCML